MLFNKVSPTGIEMVMDLNVVSIIVMEALNKVKE